MIKRRLGERLAYAGCGARQRVAVADTSDANLVMLNGNERAVWTTGTEGHSSVGTGLSALATPRAEIDTSGEAKGSLKNHASGEPTKPLTLALAARLVEAPRKRRASPAPARRTPAVP